MGVAIQAQMGEGTGEGKAQKGPMKVVNWLPPNHFYIDASGSLNPPFFTLTVALLMRPSISAKG